MMKTRWAAAQFHKRLVIITHILLKFIEANQVWLLMQPNIVALQSIRVKFRNDRPSLICLR